MGVFVSGRKKKTGYFPSKMLQEFDQRFTELGLDSTLAKSSDCDRKMSSCRTAVHSTSSHRLPIKRFIVVKSLIYCHRNDLHEPAYQWTRQWSGTPFIIPDTSDHWFCSVRLHGNIGYLWWDWSIHSDLFSPPRTPYFLPNSPTEDKRPLFISSLWR